MSRSADGVQGVDWKSWLSFAWMAAFGVLYLLMIVREKAPGLLSRLSRGG